MMRTLRPVVFLGVLVGLLGVFPCAPSVSAQETCPLPEGVAPLSPPTVTAADVDAGTADLQDFMLQLVRYSHETTTLDATTYFGCLARVEGGAFRSESTYIVTMTLDGRVYFNANDMGMGGRQLDYVFYGAILSALGFDLSDPAAVPAALANVFATGMFPNPDGGYVPGIGGYAVGYLDNVNRVPIISIAGFDLQEAHLATEDIDYGDPDTTAEQVTDRKTLKRFVTSALVFMHELAGAGDFSANAKIRVAFRDMNGPWRHGPVYLFVIDRTGYTLFHGAFPDRFELTIPTTTLRDVVTGELILPQIISAATENPNGGFVRYHFDNPDDDTDSADVPKVTYAREVTFRIPLPDGTIFSSQLIVGAGIYGDPSPDDFTHFGNGDGITSDLVFVNTSSQPNRPAIYFYDTAGGPIAADSIVAVNDDLEVLESGGLTAMTDMEPLEELTISTHGEGDLVTGSVKVIADGAIGGGLRFNLPHVGEAVVGTGELVSDVIFPVRRQAGGINTGVAIHNWEEEPLEVSCQLMSGGDMLAETAIALEPNGQTSWLIDAAFPDVDTSDFAGSLRCDAMDEGLFTALALEMDDSGARTFTTLPVFPVDQLADDETVTLDFTRFANGGGATSELVFVNLRTQRSVPPPTPFHKGVPQIQPAVYFYDAEGNPIAAGSVVDVNGDLEVTDDGGLMVRTEMEPLEMLTVSTHGRGDLMTGSLKVAADGPIGAMLRLKLPDTGETVVGAALPVGDAIFPVRRTDGGINTEVAIHNLASSTELVRCELMREGMMLDSVSLSLEANGQMSQTIDQAFATADTSDFTGSVRCAAVGEGMFSVTAIETDPATRTLIALPVFPVEEDTAEEE